MPSCITEGCKNSAPEGANYCFVCEREARSCLRREARRMFHCKTTKRMYMGKMRI
jgi:hypothetical protein